MNTKTVQNIVSGLIKIGWAVSLTVVTLTSLSPGVELPARFWNADKVFHFLGYGWLAFLPQLAFAGRRAGSRASLSMIVLGCALELAQGFIPGRFCSLGDLAANSLGVVTGLWIGTRIRPAWLRLTAPGLSSDLSEASKQ